MPFETQRTSADVVAAARLRNAARQLHELRQGSFSGSANRDVILRDYRKRLVDAYDRAKSVENPSTELQQLMLVFADDVESDTLE